MKRSQINGAIKWAKELLEERGIRLPRFAYWDMAEWRSHRLDTAVLRSVMLGWDVSDFGSGDFEHTGAVLFTIRNGLPDNSGIGTPYAEKLLIFRAGQKLPMHYHMSKTEDIINRSGGVLYAQFYNALPDGTVDMHSPVSYYSDGMTYTAQPGEKISIAAGNSVRITPRCYHILGAMEGMGPLIAGEVSTINDDRTDNFFAEHADRFTALKEDEPPLHPLCCEYALLD